MSPAILMPNRAPDIIASTTTTRMRTRSRSRGGGDAASSCAQPEEGAKAQLGNLESALTNFDERNNNQSNKDEPGNDESQPQPQISSLTINVPGADHGHGDDDRERSLTLGSEFDLGFLMNKDGRGMSISGLLTPGGDVPSGGTAVSGSTSSTQNTARAATGGGDAARERGDSTASQFLSGLYQEQTHKQQHNNARGIQGSNATISHTPPTHMGTSYENSHFGKRMRAGVSSVLDIAILITVHAAISVY